MHYHRRQSPEDRILSGILYYTFYGIGWLLASVFIGLWKLCVFLYHKWQAKQPRIFGMPVESRLEHSLVIGGSGHGKTELLKYLISSLDLEEVARGQASVVVIDSQGDMIRDFLGLSEMSPLHPQSLADRLVLIDPNDVDNPPCLNLFDFGLQRLSSYDRLEQEKILNGAIFLYEYLFGALLGAELTHRQSVIFRYLARLMMVVPGATIYTLMDFMEDPALCQPYLHRLDVSAQRFFATQFASSAFANTRQQILMRLWGVLSGSYTLARMFSHTENKLNLFEAMNHGSLILINTAKDLLKPEGCEIFGRFMIALLFQATQERAAIKDAMARLPTFVYIDEAHDYFDQTLDQLLNTARKYRVGITLATQNLDQFNPKLKATVKSSTAVKFVGGVSSDDAKEMAKEMRCEPEFILQAQKTAGESQFALFVRNHTPEPVGFGVPLGHLQRRPKLTSRELDLLLEQNRQRFCAPFEQQRLLGSTAVAHAGVGFDLEDQGVL